ncbi:phosphotransferase [Deinococcus hopiensis]|nr:phosphotransferase [Deinococcus hopiensis]
MSPASPPRRETALHLLFLHPDGERVALHSVSVTTMTYYGEHVPNAAPAHLRARLLRRLHFRGLGEEGGVRRAESVWHLHTDELDRLEWRAAWDLTEVQRTWVEAARTPATPRRAPWMRAEWHTQALAWLDAELAAQGLVRRGGPVTLKHWQISLLWRVETDGGTRVYLKAVPDFFRREVAITPKLACALPSSAPPVLAADEARGLLLMGDAGEGQDAPDLPTLMQHLAWLQRESVALLPDLPLPDHGPEYVLSRLDALFSAAALLVGEEGGLSADEAAALRARRPKLEAALARLATSPLPRTLGHGDLHGGNVVARGESFTFLDWSDVSRTHPFLDADAAYFLPYDAAPAGGRKVVEEAHDAYLDAWADFAPLSELRALHADALRVAELYRALGYVDGIQPHVEDPAEWRGAHLPHLRKLLKD